MSTPIKLIKNLPPLSSYKQLVYCYSSFMNSSEFEMTNNILRSSIPYKPPVTENVLQFVKDGLRRNQDRVLLINGPDGKRWTGSQLESSIVRLAKVLIDECGINKGDVVSLFGKNQDRIAIVLLAIIHSGAVCKLISSTVKDAAATIKVAHPKLLITDLDHIYTIKKELSPEQDKIRYLSLDRSDDEIKNISCLLDHDDNVVPSCSYDQLIESVDIDPESCLAVMQFSSGTTGKPKRIPRTHKNLCHLVASVHHPELMDFKPGVIITGSLQLAFRTGLWALLACIHSGATFVINDQSNIDSVLEIASREKATICSFSVIGLTQLSRVIEEKCKQYDLSSVEEVITAGAKIVDYDIAQNIVDVMKIKSLRQCFGMTESGWVFLIEQSLSKGNYLTVGHVVPNMEATVIDPKSGQKLGPNQKGEVALRGPQIFPGYMTDRVGVYNKDDFIDDDWFKIGDEAYYTDDGLFYIVGRYKELLTFSNMGRFYPDQIEAVLLKHPNVEACCVVKVIGTNDDLYDAARAYVILEKGSKVHESLIIDYLKENAPLVILDGGVRVMEEFPRLPNGKINKQALKSML